MISHQSQAMQPDVQHNSNLKFRWQTSGETQDAA